LKLTKAQIKQHKAALEVLAKPELTFDDKWFVLENWQESANHINSAAGAFFTPIGLARDFAIEVVGSPIIDLCAGIGCLSFMAYHRSEWDRERPRVVCVEINPDYVEVGKKILPEAEWICASAFSVREGQYGCVISNPPFGNILAPDFTGRYTGKSFEYKLIEHASKLAKHGVFIVPQQSAPFRLSGQPYFREDEQGESRKFREQTGIALEPGCGIDTSIYRDDWRGTGPTCEVVICDFDQQPAFELEAAA